MTALFELRVFKIRTDLRGKAGVVVDVDVVLVSVLVAVVVSGVLDGVVVVVVVVRLTVDLLFNTAIMTPPAVQVATNKTNQATILCYDVLLFI